MRSSYMIPVNLHEVQSTDWSVAGIYKITNTINGKCYVGQAIDIRRRLMEHAHNKHKNKVVLYKAFDKYGIDSFEARILAIINTFGKTPQEIKKELNALECFYVSLYDSKNTGYNMTDGGDSVRIGYKHSEETIEKIKEAHKNYIPKCAIIASKKTYGYDLLTGTIIEGESIAELSHKSTQDYRSIGQICNNKNYKSGGRFICENRWLFSFDKQDLMDRVDWFYSPERAEFKKHNRRTRNGGL